MGLREQIKNAKTAPDVDSLLRTGSKYEFASPRTKQSWKSTARYRLAQLTNPVPAQEASAEATPVKKSKKPNKSKSNQ